MQKRLSIFLLGLTLYTCLANALTDDNKQPLLLSADKVIINEQKHLVNYYGHVHIQQGSTKVYGDHMVSYNNQHQQLQRILIDGKPAKYQTIPELHKGTLFAHAKYIDYFVMKKFVTLLGKAMVKRQHYQLHNEIIHYDGLHKIVSTEFKSHRQSIFNIPKAGS